MLLNVLISFIFQKQTYRYRKINAMLLLLIMLDSEKTKEGFQHYTYTQFTPFSTLKNALVYPKDKQQQKRQSNVV